MAIDQTDVMEEVADRLDRLGHDSRKIVWIVFALKHLLRAGKKDDLDAELTKAENYIRRARTGEWNAELRPTHYGGTLTNSDGKE